MRLFTTSRTPVGFSLTAPVSSPALRAAMRPQSLRPVARNMCSANDSSYFSIAMDDKVRVLRRDAGDRTRMVLSGRMADVCAALERMSRAEAISCAR